MKYSEWRRQLIEGINVKHREGYECGYKIYSDYSQDKLNGVSGVKYNPGDFSYRLFDDLILTPELKEILNAYYCINADHCILDVSKPIVFKNEFFDEMLVLIGINVLNGMQDVLLNTLDCSSDFISFVGLGDMDDKTIISLMKRATPLSKLIEIFGDEILTK